MHSFPLVYFPTTTLFIDDDIDFLNALLLAISLEPGPTKACDDPKEALLYINQPIIEPLLQGQGDTEQHFQSIQHIQSLPSRTQQISTVVVDYHMPEMNGLELLQKNRQPPYSKNPSDRDGR